ncbi:MAG: peptidase [Bacteroidia bacterium]|nr:MAG: peptidase [Bacteroidia bacterium]
MEPLTKLPKKKKQNKKKRPFRYWMRMLHRDLGFLAVGLCLVYGISGILLNHLGKSDPAFKKEEKSVQIPEMLQYQQLKDYWKKQKNFPKLKKILPVNSTKFQLLLQNGVGTYDQKSGQLEYETYRKRPLVYWLNRLHYNRLKGWSVTADLFAGILIFLAISGILLVKGKKGIAGRGKWLLLAGILIPIIYILLQ